MNPPDKLMKPQSKRSTSFPKIWTCLLFLIATMSTSGVMPLSATERPNFLIFITDDQRHNDMSCEGNDVRATPKIDSIAEGGMRLTNAFVTQSLCAPSRSRASILTGKHSHANGVLTNESEWKPQEILTDHLHRVGYAYIGKCHKGQRAKETGEAK